MTQAKRCSCCGCIANLLCGTFLVVILLIIPAIFFFPSELLPQTEPDPEDCADPFLEPEDLDNIKYDPPLIWLFNTWFYIWKQIIKWSILVYVMNVFVQIYEKFLAIMNGHNDDVEDRQQSPFEIACKKYGALVIVHPKEVIFPEHIAHLLQLEAISYGIRPPTVTYEEFDPAKLLTTRHIVFIFAQVTTMPTEVNNLILNLGVNKDLVRDAFNDLKFSIYYPLCAEKFAATLSSKMEVYQAMPVPALKPVDWNDIHVFRNWSDAYWVHNLLDITRDQLLNRVLKPNPIFEQSVAKISEQPMQDEILTPYENPERGLLEFKEPVTDSQGDIRGWNIGVQFEQTSQDFNLGEQIRFLFSNAKEDVHFICEKVGIHPVEMLSIKPLETHFPKPLCPAMVTPETALMYFYDIYSPISGIMYNTLSFFAVDNLEILKLSSYGTDFLTFGKCAYPHIPALLQDFKSISMDFADLIMLLPRIPFKTGHVQEIQTEGDSTLVDICLLSHSENENETYINHVKHLSKNSSVLIQHTSIVNNYYKKLPDLQKKTVVFFLEDISVCFISSFLSNCREPLDWHIILKPNQYWTSTLQEELEDGKIKTLLIYDRPLAEMKCLDELKTLKKHVVCIIAPKSEFESYRNEIRAWNNAFSRDALEQINRWVEVDAEDI